MGQEVFETIASLAFPTAVLSEEMPQCLGEIASFEDVGGVLCRDTSRQKAVAARIILSCAIQGTGRRSGGQVKRSGGYFVHRGLTSWLLGQAKGQVKCSRLQIDRNSGQKL